MLKRVDIKDITQLMQVLNSYGTSVFFRGHADANWKLESSLERVLGKSWSAEKARRYEDYSIRTFKSKFHLYDRENITPTTKLEWMSLMQHYGVPTRLLDFTESPYVALYFALEAYDYNTANDLSVIAVDWVELNASSPKRKCGVKW